jgi:hypothetical protein
VNRSLAIGVLVGLAVGLVAGALIAKKRKPKPSEMTAARQLFPPPPGPPPPAVHPPPAPDPELATLRARIVELEAKLAPKPADNPSSTTPADEGPSADWSDRFKSLAKEGIGVFGDPEFGKLAADLKKLGSKAMEALAALLINSESAQERFLAGALMEQLADPAALPALIRSLQSDHDDMVRRMSSHAMATIGTDAALEPLRAAMTGDKEWGVRVNAAYGVAKLGQADGLKYLEEVWNSPKSPSDQKLAALGGLVHVASPSSAPVFRKILSESTDLTHLIVSIMAVQKMKDSSFIEDLNRLAGRTNVAANIREMAKKAADDLSR